MNYTKYKNVILKFTDVTNIIYLYLISLNKAILIIALIRFTLKTGHTPTSDGNKSIINKKPINV